MSPQHAGVHSSTSVAYYYKTVHNVLDDDLANGSEQEFSAVALASLHLLEYYLLDGGLLPSTFSWVFVKVSELQRYARDAASGRNAFELE